MRMGWMMLQPILPPDCVHQAAALMQHLPHCRTQSLVAKTGSDRRAVQRFREAAQRRRCVFGMVCCVHETCAQSRRHSRQPFVSTAGVLRAQPVERRGVWPQVEVRYSACGAWHPLRVTKSNHAPRNAIISEADIERAPPLASSWRRHVAWWKRRASFFRSRARPQMHPLLPHVSQPPNTPLKLSALGATTL